MKSGRGVIDMQQLNWIGNFESPIMLTIEEEATVLMFLLSICWLLIILMNISAPENLIVYMLAAGLLVVLALAGVALLIEGRRQRRLTRDDNQRDLLLHG